MSLQPGTYKITSKLSNTLIGRSTFEDLSLLPKRILAVAEGVTDCTWQIIPAGGNDQYNLLAFGISASNFEGKVFADLLDENQEKVWKVERQPQRGDNAFTIVTPNNPMFSWVVPNEEEAQVEVKPSIVTKSLPLQFVPNALFEIVAISED